MEKLLNKKIKVIEPDINEPIDLELNDADLDDWLQQNAWNKYLDKN